MRDEKISERERSDRGRRRRSTKHRNDSHPSKKIFLEGEREVRGCGHPPRRTRSELGGRLRPSRSLPGRLRPAADSTPSRKRGFPPDADRPPTGAVGSGRSSPSFTFKGVLSSPSPTRHRQQVQEKGGQERAPARPAGSTTSWNVTTPVERVKDSRRQRSRIPEEPPRREEDESDRGRAEEDLDDACRGWSSRRPAPRGSTRRAGSRSTARRPRPEGAGPRARCARRGARRPRRRCLRRAGGADATRAARERPPWRRAPPPRGGEAAASPGRLPPAPC